MFGNFMSIWSLLARWPRHQSNSACFCRTYAVTNAFQRGISNMWKYLLAWFLMLLVSIANGAIRDFTYGKQLDELTAQQLSTLAS